jgi:hypothetical protein
VRFDGTTVADDLRDEFGDFSRASQEQQLQRLNEAVYSTYCDVAIEPECKTDAARRLIEHWYDVEDGVFTTAFDDSGAPEGWRAGDVVDTPTTDDPNLHSVDSSRFDTYQKFTGELSSKRQDIARTVFQDGVMPAARLTADRFWTVNELDSSDRSAAEVLAEELGIEPLGPAPSADISGDTLLIDRGDPVFLSAAGSTFANTVNWSLAYTPPLELAGNPTFDTFSPTLIGDTSEEASFLAELPGTYRVSLTINEATTPVIETRDLTVENYTPKPFPLTLPVSEGGSSQLIIEQRLTAGCDPAGSRCVEIFGDPEAEIFVDESNWNDAENGPLTVLDQETGTIEVTAGRAGPFSGEISYSLTDIDGERVDQSITVEITSLPNPRAENDPANSVQPQTYIDLANPDCTNTTPQISKELNVLDNDFVAQGAEPLRVNTIDTTSPSFRGVVTPDGNDLRYVPELGSVGEYEFEYTVIDSSQAMRPSLTPATVKVQVGPQVTFDEVQAALGVDIDNRCFGCHNQDQDNQSSTPGIGNWALLSNVNAVADGSAQDLCTQPRTMLNPPDDRPAHEEWVPSDPNFQVVWRWIEQGKAP